MIFELTCRGCCGYRGFWCCCCASRRWSCERYENLVKNDANDHQTNLTCCGRCASRRWNCNKKIQFFNFVMNQKIRHSQKEENKAP
jgi:hypothetical protein